MSLDSDVIVDRRRIEPGPAERLLQDKGVEDMLVTVADCLKEQMANGITDETIRHQLAMYSES